MTKLFTFILIIASYSILAQTTVNGRFIVLVNNGITYQVKVQINTNTGTDDLGTSNFVSNFNNSDLSFPASPSAGTDYIFHNFSGGNYNTGTVTRPFNNEIRINIELFIPNNGTVVVQDPSWTDVVTINFTTLDTLGNSNLVWNISELDIFDADETTQWNIGNFTNENTIPLPVELNSFTAKANGSSVELKWQTATEVNNLGFEIERQIDSEEREVGSWKKVGFIEGNENSISTKNYSFTDKNPIGGSKFVYRLKQLDNDGTFSYSDEVEVELIPDKFELFQNYPNPFNPVTNIKFSLPHNSKVRLDVYNIIGEHVTTLLDKDMEAGFHNVTFRAENLSSGAYIYRIQAQNFSQTKKMLLLK